MVSGAGTAIESFWRTYIRKKSPNHLKFFRWSWDDHDLVGGERLPFSTLQDLPSTLLSIDQQTTEAVDQRAALSIS